jgi:histidine triad (HIT) family protein
VRTSVPDCPFCAIVNGEDPDAREVYRDEHVVSFFPKEPAALGHMLVIPVNHIPDIWSVDGPTATHLAQVTVRLAAVMRRALQPPGLNLIQSNGEAATQTVFHLHVHLVPRWPDDEIGPIWPRETNYRESEKDAAWEALRLACQEEMRGNEAGAAPFTPEDRRKHLDFIQAIVTRMSAASTTTKSWMLPVITATYGYAVVQKAQLVGWLGVGAVLLFAYLDANYLRQEKRFRRLYKAVAEGSNNIAVFSLNPDDVSPSGGHSAEEWASWMPRPVNQLIPGPSVWTSWAVGPFYLALMAVGVAIAVMAK